MTREHSAGVVYSPLIDGISNKIKKIPLSRFWSSPVAAEVGNLTMVDTIRATCALVMVREKKTAKYGCEGGGQQSILDYKYTPYRVVGLELERYYEPRTKEGIIVLIQTVTRYGAVE